MNIEILNEEIKFPSPIGTSLNSQNMKFLDKDFYISVLRYRITDGKRKFNLYLDFNQGVIFFLALNNQTINDEEKLIEKIFKGIKFSEKKINSPFGDKKIKGHKWKSGEYKTVQKCLKDYFKTVNANNNDDKSETQQNQQTAQTGDVDQNKTKDNDELIKIEVSSEDKQKFESLFNSNEFKKLELSQSIDDDKKNNIIKLIKLISNKEIHKMFVELEMTKNNPFEKIRNNIDNVNIKQIKEIIDSIDIRLKDRFPFWATIKKWYKDSKNNNGSINYFYESSEDKDFYREIKNTDIFLEKYMGKKIK